MKKLIWLLVLSLTLTGCSSEAAAVGITGSPDTEIGGFHTEQILEGADGEIHYSYYLPEGYDENRSYPMMVVMPGYDMMWFGEESSGRNVGWSGVQAWTKLDEDMIVVSAQLTDWHEKSARQSIELTEYFLQNFAVDENRVYAAGYSAGGETMSQAVSMRPDLYAAYLHGASQWDGDYQPLAENKVAVYIFMAENDEYYGSQKARDAYNNLADAYRESGLTDQEINSLLRLEIPDNAYFAQRGITGNYHGGGNVLFDDETILNWIISARKGQSSGFSDVDSGAWYADAVDYVRGRGLMNGTSATTFSPDLNLNRAMMATILYRASGSPAGAAPAGFSDVPTGSWYADAADWASASHIMSGYGNGRFGPDDALTRNQLVTVLRRYTGRTDIDQEFGDGAAPASRAEVAAILYRYMETSAGDTVASAAADPRQSQTLYLWEDGKMPAATEYTVNNGGYADDPDFRPYLVSFPVPEGTEVKGAVLICAGGAFQFRSDSIEGTPVAQALSRLGYQSFVVNYRLRPYTQEEGALDLARAVRFVRKNAELYGIDPNDIAVMGFSAGGILAGEMLRHYDGLVNGTALDSSYVPDALDTVSADAAACGMIYSFYGRLSVGSTDVEALKEGNLPPTFYCYGTRDPFYRQFLANADAVEAAGVSVERLQLDGYPHGFGTQGGWIEPYAEWLAGIFAKG